MASLVIIPARGGSQRIKEKNIVDFYGKPLIIYSLDAAKRSNLFDIIHVSTDSEKIKLISDDFLGYSNFRRDLQFAGDNAEILPVLRWVVEEFIKRGREFDDVCMLFPTAPLILPIDLIEAYKIFLAENRRLPVVAVAKYPVPIEWAYTPEVTSSELVRTFSHELTGVMSQKLAPKFYDAGAFAFFETKQLLDEDCDIGSNLIGYKLPRHRAVDIDTPEDLEFAKLLFKANL
jgi:CMP-N-acetylneuraminic acid synthetase